MNRNMFLSALATNEDTIVKSARPAKKVRRGKKTHRAERRGNVRRAQGHFPRIVTIVPLGHDDVPTVPARDLGGTPVEKPSAKGQIDWRYASEITEPPAPQTEEVVAEEAEEVNNNPILEGDLHHHRPAANMAFGIIKCFQHSVFQEMGVGVKELLRHAEGYVDTQIEHTESLYQTLFRYRDGSLLFVNQGQNPEAVAFESPTGDHEVLPLVAN